MSPLISVLLPTRDGNALLLEAVDSILNQTLTGLELIVIDDGGNGEVFAALPNDPRLRLLANPEPGLVGALNAGAAAARAPLLARMDGDDIALPERLRRQTELLLTRPRLGIVGAQVEVFAEQPLGVGYRVYQDWINGLLTPARIARDIFIESPIPHPSAVLRREVFERLGGYRDRGWPEDYDLWLRAYAAGVAMAKPEGILLRWRDRPGRTSRIDPRYRLERFARAKAHFLTRTLLADRPAVIWGAAPTGALLYDCLAAEGGEVRAFIDIDRKKIGGRKRGRPVLGPEAATRLDGELILVAVGARGARGQIRAALEVQGLREGVDFCVTA